MLYEFAITPEVFHPKVIAEQPQIETGIEHILDAICKDGLIDNLHKGQWMNLVQGKLLPGLPSTLRDEIREKLEYLDNRKRILSCPECSAGEPTNTDHWLEAAKEISAHVPLRGIIVSKKLFDRHHDPNLPLIDAGCATRFEAWKKRVDSKMVSTDVQTYKENLEPILRYAKRVTLIDPHLNCEDRFFDTIELCCRLLGQRRSRDERTGYIDIHTGDPDSSKIRPESRRRRREDCLAEWKARLFEVTDSYRYNFTVSLWDTFYDSERFHDRYIITDQCGIGIKYGLDIVAGNETEWNLIADEVQKKHSLPDTF